MKIKVRLLLREQTGGRREKEKDYGWRVNVIKVHYTHL
jgi:hypothetical protein